MKSSKINWQPMAWRAQEVPNGFLPRFEQEPAAHALWYYYVLTQNALEMRMKDLRYDDEPVLAFDDFNRVKMISIAYGVTPERMTKHWAAVDMECHRLNLPKLPQGLRFTSVASISN